MASRSVLDLKTLLARPILISLLVGLLVACLRAQSACAYIESLSPSLPDSGFNDTLGFGVAVCGSGEHVAIGAPGHSHTGTNRGVVLVAKASPPSAAVELTPTAPLDGMWFGYSVDMNLDGDVMVVGAPGSGIKPRAFVFRRIGGTWIEEWVSPLGLWDLTGLRVSINDAGDLIAIGAPARKFGQSGTHQGAVDLYRYGVSGWLLEKSLTIFGGGGFGSKVVLSGDGDVLAVRSQSGFVNGSVYVYQHNGGAWDQVGHLHEAVSHSGLGGFGSGLAVDLTGDTIVVGNYGDYRMGYQSGAVFVFDRDAVGWAMTAELLNPTPSIQYWLGWSVALNAAGDRIFASAPYWGFGTTNPGDIGAVYEYERSATGWQQVGTHVNPDPAAKASAFAYSLATSATGQRFVAGAPYMSTPLPETGAAHVFDSTCSSAASYCTAQVNSLGCSASIEAQGTPSANSMSSFRVSARNVRNQQNGMMLYGVERASIPWLSGTLCIQPPLRRTPVVNSGGSPLPANDCSGVLVRDFNAWAATANDPLLFAGQHVRAQFYSRDPGAVQNVNLSDAIEFYLEP